jgi:Zn-dependent peptidase ImmA (M78 family)
MTNRTGESIEDYSPWTLLSQLPHIRLRCADLGDDLLGFWDPDTSEIVLNSRQSRRQMRCTLMHELEHAGHGDDGTIADVSPVLAARQEIRACARAARHLIPIDVLIKALHWTHEEAELAEELNVDTDTLRIRLLTLTPAEHAIIDHRVPHGQSA